MVSPLATGATSQSNPLLGTKPSTTGSGGVNGGVNGGIVPPDILAQVAQTLQSKNTLAPKLNAALANDRTKLSGLGQLQSALSNFQNVVQGISGEGLNTSATSSSTAVLGASSSKSAQAGKFQVVVTQLAQSQVLQTRAQSAGSATADTPIGSGSPSNIKIELGSLNSSGFVPNGAAKSIAIKTGSNSLQGIAAAINDANIGVSAKVVKNGKEAALTLTGPSGANQTLRIAVSGDADLQKLLNFNPAGAQNLNQITAAQDAQFKVNGVAGSSSSNVVTTAIPGTRLELAGKGSSEVSVAQDNTQIANNVSRFVTAFNSLNSKLKTLGQGELKSEGSPARVQDQLARTLRNSTTSATSATSTTGEGSSFNLASAGITVTQNGDLALDKAKLQAAIVTDPGAVSRLFAQENTGLADGLNSQIKTITGAQGSISRETASINKDISNLNTKKAGLAAALTAQANALVRQYSQQGDALPGLGGKGGSSLFDII